MAKTVKTSPEILKKAEEAQKILSQAEACRKQGQFDAATQAYARLLNFFPDDYRVSRALMGCLKRSSLDDQKISYADAFCLKFPECDYFAFTRVQFYAKAKRTDEATSLLNEAEKQFPGNAAIPTMRMLIAKMSDDEDAALKYALQAVATKPHDPQAHNNLGTTLADRGFVEEGLASYETAALLNPNFTEGIGNVGYAHSRLGNFTQAVQWYDRAISTMRKHPTVREEAVLFPASFPNLALGNLVAGWDYYEYGFTPAATGTSFRNPYREFDVPKWTGQPIPGKTLLIWREQGLGDEIMFLSCLAEAVAMSGAEKVVYETDPRLVTLLARSFPDIEIRPQEKLAESPRSLREDYDYHMPVGSLMRLVRGEIGKFKHAAPILVPYQKDVEAIEQILTKMGLHGLRVGICWRSGALNTQRNNNYLNLADLSPLITCPGAHIINLQYGDCEQEILAAERTLKKKIHRWPDLDLKNDLEGVCALMATLDVVVSVGTAVCVMSAATGVPTIRLAQNDWTTLGTGGWPWYPQVETYLVEAGHSLSEQVLHVERKVCALANEKMLLSV